MNLKHKNLTIKSYLAITCTNPVYIYIYISVYIYVYILAYIVQILKQLCEDGGYSKGEGHGIKY